MVRLSSCEGPVMDELQSILPPRPSKVLSAEGIPGPLFVRGEQLLIISQNHSPINQWRGESNLSENSITRCWNYVFGDCTFGSPLGPGGELEFQRSALPTDVSSLPNGTSTPAPVLEPFLSCHRIQKSAPASPAGASGPDCWHGTGRS